MTDISSQDISAIYSNFLLPAPPDSFHHFIFNFQPSAAYYHLFHPFHSISSPISSRFLTKAYPFLQISILSFS